MAEKKNKGGRPKSFKSGDELIKLFSAFCEDIISGNYMDVPTQTAFCRWLSKNYTTADRRTIYNSLNRYFPAIKKEFEQMQGDIIAQGGMLGAYNPTMSIFALKNWCKWQDKTEREETSEDNRLHDNIVKAIKAGKK